MSEASKAIWKFPIAVPGGVVTMPYGAQILTAQVQGNTIMLWAVVDPAEAVRSTRRFEIVGTGWSFKESDKRYIATVQQNGFVWHVFEVVGALGRLVSALV